MAFIPYPIIAFLAICVFASVHLWAGRLTRLNNDFQARFLSIGGGIAISYVFLDLLSKLCAGDLVVRKALTGVFPFAERHVYIMALLGFLLFFIVDRFEGGTWKRVSTALSITSYSLFNFFVGYAVTYKDDPDIQPLALFTFAMALHYFTNDYTLTRDHPDMYRKEGRWILIGSLFMGWFVGCWIVISPAAIALINAFIGGGVIMNVMRHELPSDNPNNTMTFLTGTVVYGAMLLMIGSS